MIERIGTNSYVQLNNITLASSAAAGLIVAIFLLGFAIFPTEQADAAILIFIQDQESCEDSPINGSWDSGTSRCDLTNGLGISGGDEVEVAPGVNVRVQSPQSIHVSADGALTIASGGSLNVLAGPAGGSSFLGIRNEGVITNHGTLSIVNFGGDSVSSSTGMGNLGTINNYGVMHVRGSTFGAGGVALYNGGTFINHDRIFISASDGISLSNPFNGNLTNFGLISTEVLNTHGIAIMNAGNITSSGELHLANLVGIGLYLIDGGTIHNPGLVNITGRPDSIPDRAAVGIAFSRGSFTINNTGSMVMENPNMIVGIQSLCDFLGPCTLDIIDGGTIDILSGGIVNVTDNSILNIHSGVTANLEDGGTINIGAGGVVKFFCGATLNELGGDVIGTITFEQCDTTAPVITILGDNPATVLVGQTYTDAGVTVTDDIDPSPSLNTVSTVNTAVAGTYTVTYTAEDDAGNESTATRTVNVITDSTAIQNLIDNIKSQVTDKNVKNSLLGPLKEVQKILNDSNPNNDSAACGKLADFNSNVNSKEASGKLSSTLAQQYRDAADQIRSSLGC